MKLQNLLALSLLTILTISGCGGDGDSPDGTSPSTEATTQEPLVIDGYTLPPDPGEAGKATLLGIDSNDNGIRDDVERAIYLTYNRPMEREIVIQFAREFEMVMKDPIAMATSEEFQKISFKSLACAGYLRVNYNLDLDKKYKESPITFLLNSYMNTKDRIKARMEWNGASSGGVYSVPGIEDNSADACDFNITEVIESY